MKLIICAILLALGCRGGAEPIIRVGVLRASKPHVITVKCNAAMRFSDQTMGHASIVEISATGSSIQILCGRNRKRLPSLAIESDSPIRLHTNRADSIFRGKLRFSSHGSRLLIVNEIGLENYVRGVVANEMRHEWPCEALKAQAVIARTLAIQRLREHRGDGFDICDSTHCQVYRGAATETQSTDAAVRATAGEILTYQQIPIQALYGSCCGGVTASSYASKRLGYTPYLKIKKDILNGATACKYSPHFEWNYAISASNLAVALRSDSRTHPGNSLSGFRIIEADSSNRATFIEIKGERTREVDAYICWNVICRKLGWGSIKSARFGLVKTVAGYKFYGHGLGHGIGLCQWGANARAKAGWNYHKILAFYYPNAGVSLVRDEITQSIL